MSDLHLDHDDHYDRLWLEGLKPQPGIDLLVLAGDWFSVYRPLETQDLFNRLLDVYDKILAVPGNHDYWRVDPAEANAEMTKHNSGRLSICTEPQFVVIKGQRFLGGTMWYRKPSRRQRPDFIDMDYIKTPKAWMFEQQGLFQRVLCEDQQMEETIVVTHHLPHPQSTPIQFRGTPNNHFFMCNMSDAIAKKKPKMWLHGHTHDPCDYVVESTRIVCHPRGYPFEYKNRAPYQAKLIEI